MLSQNDCLGKLKCVVGTPVSLTYSFLLLEASCHVSQRTGERQCQMISLHPVTMLESVDSWARGDTTGLSVVEP